MRIAVIGAGPAGLYFAYRLKRARPDASVRIFEQNRTGATFGFGIVFSDRALDFLSADDPETFTLVSRHLERWNELAVVHRGQRVPVDGIGFAAIGRLAFLKLLQQRAASLKLEPVYGRRIDNVGELGEFDLIIGADGVSSTVRQSRSEDFATETAYLSNRYAWYGTSKPFECLTQTFVETEHGAFNAHHYRYAPNMSTFIVETSEDTWLRSGLDRLDEAASQRFCEAAFAETLDQAPLISNRSAWRRFPQVRNRRFAAGNAVLIGDALHTAHFSIGSGTRLALEDAVALAKSIAGHPGDLPEALADFEAARRPVLDKLLAAADASGRWYEQFDRHMALAPVEFAMSYLCRSGRVAPERIAETSPRFMAEWTRRRTGRLSTTERDGP
ncbi:MAG TPA: FAD-dependent monooxygenase [Aestuariivirgaceae bacterium]|nr:FAD-dependent monooxygenase [Aestuariivirgaceae bacterium]